MIACVLAIEIWIMTLSGPWRIHHEASEQFSFEMDQGLVVTTPRHIYACSCQPKSSDWNKLEKNFQIMYSYLPKDEEFQ